MKKIISIFIKLIVFFPLLLLLMTANFLGDAGGVFKTDNAEMAKAMLAGHKVCFKAVNGNEREVKKNFIEEFPSETDCLIFGPSTSNGIRRENVGGGTSYNLSVSSADLYDIMAQLALLEINHKHFKRIVFNMDLNFFNEDIYNANPKNKRLKPYAEYMLKKINNENSEKPKEDLLSDIITKVRTIFSVSYFQVSFPEMLRIASVSEDGYKSLFGKGWRIAEDGYKGLHWLPDGSVIYAEGNAKGKDYVVKYSKEYDIKRNFEIGKSEYAYEILDKLVQYLTQQGIKVTLYLNPVAPSLWDRIKNEMPENVLEEMKNYSKELSYKYKVDIVGSFNPYDVSLKDEDFYDGIHVKHDIIKKVFDFR